MPSAFAIASHSSVVEGVAPFSFRWRVERSRGSPLLSSSCWTDQPRATWASLTCSTRLTPIRVLCTECTSQHCAHYPGICAANFSSGGNEEAGGFGTNPACEGSHPPPVVARAGPRRIRGIRSCRSRRRPRYRHRPIRALGSQRRLALPAGRDHDRADGGGVRGPFRAAKALLRGAIDGRGFRAPASGEEVRHASDRER